MGFGLPAAIAAKLVRPEKQVLALIGDGGFVTPYKETVKAAPYHPPS